MTTQSVVNIVSNDITCDNGGAVVSAEGPGFRSVLIATFTVKRLHAILFITTRCRIVLRCICTTTNWHPAGSQQPTPDVTMPLPNICFPVVQ